MNRWDRVVDLAELEHFRWGRRSPSSRAPRHAAAVSGVVNPRESSQIPKAHTCEIVTTVDAGAFLRWTGTRWMRRGEDYEALKARMSEERLDVAERHVPGLRALAAHAELRRARSQDRGHPGVGVVVTAKETREHVRSDAPRGTGDLPGEGSRPGGGAEDVPIHESDAPEARSNLPDRRGGAPWRSRPCSSPSASRHGTPRRRKSSSRARSGARPPRSARAS